MGKIKAENGEKEDAPVEDPVSKKLKMVYNERKSKISHENCQEDVKK